MTSYLLRLHIHDVIGIGAMETVNAMLHQNCSSVPADSHLVWVVIRRNESFKPGGSFCPSGIIFSFDG